MGPFIDIMCRWKRYHNMLSERSKHEGARSSRRGKPPAEVKMIALAFRFYLFYKFLRPFLRSGVEST
jgi:hypothetical protein